MPPAKNVFIVNLYGPGASALLVPIQYGARSCGARSCDQSKFLCQIRFMLVRSLNNTACVLQDMDLVPSHVVPSLTQDREHNDVYSAYNKPGAVMYWLRVSFIQ